MNKKYQIIYADCCWSFNNKNTGGNLNSGSANKYDTLTVQDLCKLPIQNITADDSVLFSWWVGAMPEEALMVMKAWGFKLKTMTGFTWVKTTKNHKPFFGMGFWSRQGTENCLIAVKGKPHRISASVRSTIDFEYTGEAENTKHSKKPDIFRDKIVELMGDLPRIELFARQKTPGWDVWGNEVECDIGL
jgi:N6-adenosine-specific RNA methylase IME4